MSDTPFCAHPSENWLTPRGEAFISDARRLAAARRTATRLHRQLGRVRNKIWSHWIDSAGGVTSERA